MRTLLGLLVMAAFAGVAIADVNATGTWSGSFNITRSNGEMKDSTALLKLKQTGTDITGTVGPDEGKQFPIQKGKIEGDKITLDVDNEGQKIKFDLKLDGDRIIGEADMTGEHDTAHAKLELNRVK